LPIAVVKRERGNRERRRGGGSVGKPKGANALLEDADVEGHQQTYGDPCRKDPKR
jgi:hypothetical protein